MVGECSPSTNDHTNNFLILTTQVPPFSVEYKKRNGGLTLNQEEASALITKTAQLFEEHQSDEAEVIATLESYGLPFGQARKLSTYVKTAFSWAVLQNMGVKKFASDFQIRANNGSVFHIPVAGEQLFTSALAMAIGVLKHGYDEDITVSVFEAVVSQSDDINMANEALAKGIAVEDTEILTTFHGFDPEDFGKRSKSWWQFWR